MKIEAKDDILNGVLMKVWDFLSLFPWFCSVLLLLNKGSYDVSKKGRGKKKKGTKGNEKESQEGKKKKKKKKTENLLNERIGQRTKPTKTRVGS